MKKFVSLVFLSMFTVLSLIAQNEHEKRLLNRLLEKKTLEEMRDMVRMVQPMIKNMHKWNDFSDAEYEDLESLFEKLLNARSFEEAKFLIEEHNQMHQIKELTDSDSDTDFESELSESETEDLDESVRRELLPPGEEVAIDLDAVVWQEDAAAQQKTAEEKSVEKPVIEPVIESEEPLHEVKVRKSRPRSMRVITSKLREEPDPRSSNLLYNKWRNMASNRMSIMPKPKNPDLGRISLPALPTAAQEDA